PAVSDTFASALWAPDILFEMLRGGIDGVNIHTFPGAGYELFTMRHSGSGWSVAIAPEYYGLLLFGRAAPSGSVLLPQSGDSTGAVKVWSTLARDHRVRVLIINKDLRHGHTVAVRIPGAHSAAELERLAAPAASGTRGITLAGQSFAAESMTGRLRGERRTTEIDPDGSTYTVVLSAASAALLTVPPVHS
ncbi:MAG: glycosyl hydrolase family 79 C-terminal domain-containing protein, partial [Solirubrobacteraceae bacterium]